MRKRQGFLLRVRQEDIVNSRMDTFTGLVIRIITMLIAHTEVFPLLPTESWTLFIIEFYMELNSWLGFPIMDQEERDGHGYSDFEGGYISWDQTEMKYKDFEYSKGTISVTTNKETATFKLIGWKIYIGSGKSWSKTDLPYGDYY